jgi:hypothetical protein
MLIPFRQGRSCKKITKHHCVIPTRVFCNNVNNRIALSEYTEKQLLKLIKNNITRTIHHNEWEKKLDNFCALYEPEKSAIIDRISFFVIDDFRNPLKFYVDLKDMTFASEVNQEIGRQIKIKYKTKSLLTFMACCSWGPAFMVGSLISLFHSTYYTFYSVLLMFAEPTQEHALHVFLGAPIALGAAAIPFFIGKALIDRAEFIYNNPEKWNNNNDSDDIVKRNITYLRHIVKHQHNNE